jgi:predicted RNA-binding protein with PIN domain
VKTLIDGHNALGALDIRGRTHEERRHALMSMVASLASDAVIYFDAQKSPEGLLNREGRHGVLAEYCRDAPADDYILEAVRNARRPADILVVSNDREVAGKAKQQGAKSMGIQEFFLRGRQKGGKDGRGKGATDSAPRLTADRLRGMKTDYKPSDFGLPDEVDLDNPDID